jgi:hypothetical protein
MGFPLFLIAALLLIVSFKRIKNLKDIEKICKEIRALDQMQIENLQEQLKLKDKQIETYKVFVSKRKQLDQEKKELNFLSEEEKRNRYTIPGAINQHNPSRALELIQIYNKDSDFRQLLGQEICQQILEEIAAYEFQETEPLVKSYKKLEEKLSESIKTNKYEDTTEIILKLEETCIKILEIWSKNLEKSR